LKELKEENIVNHIYFIRGEKVMLDLDLASLYNIETRVLKQAVKRNIRRFPDDFMLELTEEEINLVVSQNVIPSRRYFGGAKPFAFTEQGVAMLSGILNSERAIQVNIAIMRTFVQIRKFILSNKEIEDKISGLEEKYDKNFAIIFKVLQKLIEKKDTPRRQIGYKVKNTK